MLEIMLRSTLQAVYATCLQLEDTWTQGKAAGNDHRSWWMAYSRINIYIKGFYVFEALQIMGIHTTLESFGW